MIYQFYRHSQTPVQISEIIKQKTNTNNNPLTRHVMFKDHPQSLIPIISHVPTQKTDQDRRLYEDDSNCQIQKRMACTEQNVNRQEDGGVKNRIDLAIMIMEQNQKMVQKIAEVRRLIAEEGLKAKIFQQNIQRNEDKIKELRLKKEEIQQNERMMTLNESFIPNKSAELGSTLNTISWMNQFLNKDELENLWLQNRHQMKKQKSKKGESKIKSYTIDLSSAMTSARQKPQKSVRSIEREAIINNYIQQKQDVRNKIVKDKNQSAGKNHQRINLKVDITQKSRQPAKNMSQVRNLKRIKNNPEY